MTFDQAVEMLLDEKTGRKDWHDMVEAAKNNDPGEFFRLYSKYLEANNLMSASRIVVHKMCVAAGDRLSPVEVMQNPVKEVQLEFDFGGEEA